MHVRLLIALLGVALAAPAVAQQHPSLGLEGGWKLEISGQLRDRLNAHHGRDFDSDSRSSTTVGQRARVGATAAHESGVTLGIQLQDVRVWGEELDPTSSMSANNLDVHQAWASAKLGKATLKVGRQELAFDNQRLVGALDWADRARTFDGARLTLALGVVEADVFYAKVNQRYTDIDGTTLPDANKDADFGGVHAASKLGGAKVGAIYAVNAVYTGTKQVRHTVGANAFGAAGAIGYGAEAYYQFGHQGGERIDAWLAAARGSYALPVALAPTFSVFGEVASGDGTAEGSFDTLYATNHKFYGELDMFLNLPVHTGRNGLIDAGAGLAIKPLKAVTASVDVHSFRAVEENAAGETHFGEEVDLKVGYTGIPRLGVSLLYGIFFPDDGLRGTHGITTDRELDAEQGVYLTMDFTL